MENLLYLKIMRTRVLRRVVRLVLIRGARGFLWFVGGWVRRKTNLMAVVSRKMSYKLQNMNWDLKIREFY